MPEEDTLSALSCPSKLHSHMHPHTQTYTPHTNTTPKQLKEKKGEWMRVHFVKLTTQQETTGWEKVWLRAARCWGKTWAQEINLKLTSESTINCSYACGKVVTNEPELGGGLVNCSHCMKCVPWWSLPVEDNRGVAQRGDREISHRSLSRYSHKWGKKKAGGSWERGWRWCGNTPYCFCFLRTWMQYPTNY